MSGPKQVKLDRPPARRYGASTSSIVNCQQKLACGQEGAQAVFMCDECSPNNNLQCAPCKSKIHSDLKYEHHNPSFIHLPSRDELCWFEACEKRNFVDQWCYDCSKNYCFDCCRVYHHKSSRKKLHRIVKYKDYQEELERRKEAGDEVFESVESAHFEDADGVSGQFQSFGDQTSPPYHAKPSPQPAVMADYAVQAGLAASPYGKQEDFTPRPGRPIRTSTIPAQRLETEAAVLPVESEATRKTRGGEGPTINLSSPGHHHAPPTLAATVEGLEGSTTSDGSRPSIPDVLTHASEVDLVTEMQSVNLVSGDMAARVSSFELLDEHEHLKVRDEADLLQKLGCRSSTAVKVLAIVGNTGDGKSHTLNHAFFGGCEVFPTSPDQTSCTVGVRAAYDKAHKLVLLDTEGLLGVTGSSNKRMRLILKVLAISDIIVLRTKAERLHTDMFQFLADVSRAYSQHFAAELKTIAEKCDLKDQQGSLGPAVVVFHETHHTDVLGSRTKTGNVELGERFAKQQLSTGAFRTLQYVGVKTHIGPTDFAPLRNLVEEHIRDTGVRAARRPGIILQCLKTLNQKFNGEMGDEVVVPFPDQYFTCRAHCTACKSRCKLSMGHEGNKQLHEAPDLCCYVAELDNKVYLCKGCLEGSRREKVVLVPKTCSAKDSAVLGWAKYAWSGYVLECRNCGVVYNSRKHWYGNSEPDTSVAKTEIRHSWPEAGAVTGASANTAQRVLDGVGYLSSTIADYSQGPTRAIASYVADQVAPAYWRPNAEIKECIVCEELFMESDTKHHCRACGQGVCGKCSIRRRPVPERGWPDPVRVCNNCFDGDTLKESAESTGSEGVSVTARKLTETVAGTLGAVASAIEYPKGLLKASARPTYWTPDEDCVSCVVCSEAFSPVRTIHHCRACGRGVCAECSTYRLPVPDRGWDGPVRVCKRCHEMGVQ